MARNSRGTGMDEDRLRQEALEYHATEPAGKIRVEPTKPHGTARELSLAYSPGVAYPCEEIAENPDDAYQPSVSHEDLFPVEKSLVDTSTYSVD